MQRDGLFAPSADQRFSFCALRMPNGGKLRMDGTGNCSVMAYAVPSLVHARWPDLPASAPTGIADRSGRKRTRGVSRRLAHVRKGKKAWRATTPEADGNVDVSCAFEWSHFRGLAQASGNELDQHSFAANPLRVK